MDTDGTDNALFQWFGRLVGAESQRELLIWLGLLLIAVYLIKNTYLLFAKYVQLRFVFNNRLELSGRLMRNYMKKPYPFHLEKNSSEILRSVTSDVNNLYELVMDVIDLVSNLLIIAMLAVYLLYTDVVITLVVAALLGLCSYFYFCDHAETYCRLWKTESDLQWKDDSGGQPGVGRNQRDQGSGAGELFCPRV